MGAASNTQALKMVWYYTNVYVAIGINKKEKEQQDFQEKIS